MFQTEALWSMTSPNAVSFNNTLNGTATGFDVIPIIIMLIVGCLIVGVTSVKRGFT